MGNPFKKVQPGQKLEIPAEAFNTFIDAAIDFKSRRTSMTQGHSGLGRRLEVLVRNAGDVDCPRFGALIIAGAVVSPSDNLTQFLERPAFSATPPSSANYLGPLCIAAEPIPAGKMGLATIHGVTPCNILVSTSAPGAVFARATPDHPEYLTTSPAGQVLLLWRESGDSGTKWGLGIVTHYRQPIIRFELLGGFDSSGLAAARLIDETGTPAGETIYVSNGVGMFIGAAGRKGYAVYMLDSGRFEVIQLQC